MIFIYFKRDHELNIAIAVGGTSDSEGYGQSMSRPAMPMAQVQHYFQKVNCLLKMTSLVVNVLTD